MPGNYYFMKTILYKLGNWKIIIISSGLFLLFKNYLFTKFILKANNEILKPLDLRFSYRPEDVSEFFSLLGKNGRVIYKLGIITLDSVYPFVYTLLLISVLSFLLKKIVNKSSKYLYLSMLPVVVLLFDFTENLNTLSMLKHFPEIPVSSVRFGSVATSLKWTFLILNLFFIAATASYWLYKSQKSQD